MITGSGIGEVVKSHKMSSSTTSGLAFSVGVQDIESLGLELISMLFGYILNLGCHAKHDPDMDQIWSFRRGQLHSLCL